MLEDAGVGSPSPRPRRPTRTMSGRRRRRGPGGADEDRDGRPDAPMPRTSRSSDAPAPPAPRPTGKPASPASTTSCSAPAPASSPALGHALSRPGPPAAPGNAQRDQHLRVGERPVLAPQPGHHPVDPVRRSAPSRPARSPRRHRSARRTSHPRVPSRSHDLLTGAHVRAVPELRRPTSRAPDSARPGGVDVADPGLAEDRATSRRSVGRVSRSKRRSSGTSISPWSAVTSSATSSAASVQQPGHQRVHAHQCRTVGRRSTPWTCPALSRSGQ